MGYDDVYVPSVNDILTVLIVSVSVLYRYCTSEPVISYHKRGGKKRASLRTYEALDDQSKTGRLAFHFEMNGDQSSQCIESRDYAST